MIQALLVFLAQTLTAATPLLLAAMGGVLSERSGVATISLEGYLLGGALGAAVAALATGSALAAVLAGLLTGALLGGLFALGSVTFRAQPIVVGVALNLLAASGTRVAIKLLYDSASNSPPLLERAARTGSIARVALLGVLSQPVVYLAALSVPFAWAVLERSVFGLRVTAAGEHPEACRAQGVSVARVRWGALVAGGALTALGGVHLTLTQHEFVAYMSGGRGFLALAAVILGSWRPLRAGVAAVAVGALYALEATLAGRVPVPPAVLEALPFAVTLAAVVGLVGRARAPRALGAAG